MRGVRAAWIFDNCASTSYITTTEIERLGLVATKAPPMRILHSDGQEEVSAKRATMWVRLGPAGVAKVEAYVLRRTGAPAGMIIGRDWMAEHLFDGSVRKEGDRASMTIGGRRIELAPGPNQVSDDADLARVVAMSSPQRDAEDGYLLFVGLNNDGETVTTTLDARAKGAAGPEQDGLREWWREKLKGFRREQRADDIDPSFHEWARTLPERRSTLFSEYGYDETVKHPLNEQQLRLKGKPPDYSPKLRPMSPEKREVLRKFIETLLAKGLISPSASSAGAPVLIVPKANGGWRFTVDYRDLNAVLESDQYRSPQPDDLYQQMRGAKYFARMDARDGFWGCPVRDEDRRLLAFQTCWGLYQFNVMPMGVKTSPAHYQRMMDAILRPFIGRFVVVYQDDVLIWADSPEQLRERIDAVLDVFERHSLRLKPEKCAWFLSSVRFLGHVVDQHGLHADATKVEALASMPRPTQVRHVRELLGMAQYLRQYVPHITDICGSLFDLTKKGAKFVWEERHQVAYETLVSALCEAPVLAIADPARPKGLLTDSSAYAMGMVLLQLEEDGLWHPVSYHSQRFSPEQARQSATVREFLALEAGVRRWRHLMGTEITAFSDHKPLEALRSAGARLPPIIGRRLDSMLEMDIKVRYKPGADVGLADWLSRDPRKRQALESIRTEHPVHPFLRLCSMAVDEHIRTTPGLLQQLREAHANIAAPPEEHCERRDGMWWYTARDEPRLFVPTELRAAILRAAHDDPESGHQGATKTLARLTPHVHWASMQQDVRAYVGSCERCQLAKKAPHRNQGLASPMPAPFRKWAWVALDLVGPLTASGPEQHTAILVVVDKLSKRVRYLPTYHTCTSEQAAELYYRNIWSQHGYPVRLVSDRGTQFTADVWRQLWALTGTHLNFATTNHPQTDGQAEGAIGTWAQTARTFANLQGDNWARWLPSLEFAYNSAPVRTTGMSPFMMEYGQEPLTALAYTLNLTQAPSKTPCAFVEEFQRSIATAREALQATIDAQQEATNKGRRATSYAVGDFAYVKRDKRNMAHKLEPPWEGPYPVVRTLERDGAPQTAVVLRVPGGRHSTFNVSKLKRHRMRRQHHLHGAVEDHRVTTAEDGCEEIQYRIGGRWWQLLDAVVDAGKWTAITEYHARHPPDHPRLVGGLVQKRFRRQTYVGRVAYFDPGDKQVVVVYSDGDSEGMPLATARRRAMPTAALHAVSSTRARALVIGARDRTVGVTLRSLGYDVVEGDHRAAERVGAPIDLLWIQRQGRASTAAHDLPATWRQWSAVRSKTRPRKWVIISPASKAALALPTVAAESAHLQFAATCRYGDLHRQRLAVWTNVPVRLDSCTSSSPCALLRNLGHHPRSAQQGTAGAQRGRDGSRAQLPYQLLFTIALACDAPVASRDPGGQ